MSLLLDALNRASKEKQKAAAAALPGAEPVEPLQWEPLPAAALHAPAPEPQPPVVHSAAGPETWELSLARDVEPVALPVAEVLPTPPAPVATPVPVLAPSLEPAPVVVEPPYSPAVSTPAATVTAAIEPTLQPAAVVPPVVPPSGGSSAPPVSQNQVAQEILRASAPQPAAVATGRRRVWMLGGLAAGLAIVFAGVFSGLLGDPGQLLGFGASSSLGVPPVDPSLPGAPTVAAPAEAPVASAADVVAVPTSAPLSVTTGSTTLATPAAYPQTVEAPGVKGKPGKSDVAPATTRLRPGAQPTVAQRATVPKPKLDAADPPGTEVALRAGALPKTAVPMVTRGVGPLEQGYAALLQGRFDAAAQAYRQALRANAQERDALLGMAYISQKQGQRAEAQVYYREVLRQEPNNSIALAGLRSLDAQADSNGLDTLGNGLAGEQPDSAAAMAVAGSALVREGRLGDAAQAFARAQALEPTNPLHAYNHAVAQDRMGRHDAALRLYDNVLKLDAAAPPAMRAYQVDAVRARAAQLRAAMSGTPRETP